LQGRNVAAETRREGNGTDHETPGTFYGATNDPRQRQVRVFKKIIQTIIFVLFTDDSCSEKLKK
jgi:hypothetical protein